MTQFLPDIYRAITFFAAAAGTTSAISVEDIGQLEEWGIAGVCAIVAVLFYNMSRYQSKARDAEHKARIEEYKTRIAAMDAEILRLRSSSENR